MSFFVKHKKLIIIIIILSVILILILGLLYGRFIGTNGLIVKDYKVVNKKLPDSFNGLKIVHITDIHYKRTTSKKDLQELVKKINFIKPDIVVLTGDLFDRDRNLDNNQKDELMFELKKIDATINKYAIKGNHDKDESWEYIITEAGFINLNNTYDIIYNDGYEPILIAGMSSITSSDKVKNKIKKINKYKEEYNEENLKYKILLTHQTDYIKDFDFNEYSLILGGHSHGGQVRFPIIGAVVLPKGSKKYYEAHYKLNDTDLFISSGIGTSNINLRLFNKPSFNFYRLYNK